MKIDGLTHPKTKELAFTLEIPLPHAIGLLELLWAFVAQQTPQGNIGKWSNQVIAGEAGWQGDADQFVSALISVGFLDENDDHRLLVHDWSDHAPNWVHAKLKKKGRAIISPDLSPDLREGQDPPPGATTSLAKPSQASKDYSPDGECESPDGESPDDDGASKKPPTPLKEILELYRSCCPSLPDVVKLTPAREQAIRARWRNELPTLEDWEQYFRTVEMSDFLSGRAPPSGARQKPFRADLDFLIKQGNCVKVMEGKYDD
jgi:hypothetical protein